MLKNDLNLFEYQNNSFKHEKIDWWLLPKELKLLLEQLPSDIIKFGKFTTIRRLLQSNQKSFITRNIIGIKKTMFGDDYLPIKFPINLISNEYAQLYALMISEGSHNTEFSINVPEKEFHQLFRKCIQKIISPDAAKLIKLDYNNCFLRSRAPAVLRYIIPVPKIVPEVITTNKELSRKYLQVAFEAEGSPIFDGKHKRYIKLTRYRDITSLITNESLPLKKRIYMGTIKKEYSELFTKIVEFPPETLLGEHLMLKFHFGIDNKIILEAIRQNSTDLRAGKITARWVLLIYANNINRFIEEINFLSPNKINKCTQMLSIRANRQQYSSLEIIKKITKNDLFDRKDFMGEMARVGYKSPGCYLYRYEQKCLIKKCGGGKYKLLIN